MHTTYGIFPVPIYCNDLGRGFTVEEMDAMKAYATDCQVGISGNNMSNSASVLDNPVLKDLKAFVEQNVAAYLAEVEAPSDDVGAYITHSFLNFIDRGQGHFRHAHFNSFISGVLYINANRDTDRIHFYREKYSYFPHFNRKSNNGFNADIIGKKDETQVNQYSGQALAYTVGSSGLVPGADEVLRGKKALEKVDFEFTPEDGVFKGDKITLEITINSVNEKVLPEANDDFAKMASEFDTLKDLMKSLEQKVKDAREIEQTYLARDKVSEELIGLMEKVPLPENAIQAELEAHFKDGHGDETHKKEVEKNSRRSMQAQFILDRIAEEENIGVNDADLSEWITQNAIQYRMEPKTFADALVRSGEITLVMGEIRRSKALTLVLTESEVKDTEGKVVDVAKVLKPFTEPQA